MAEAALENLSVPELRSLATAVGISPGRKRKRGLLQGLMAVEGDRSRSAILRVLRELAPGLRMETIEAVLKELPSCEHNLVEVNEEESNDLLDPMVVLEPNYAGILLRCNPGQQAAPANPAAGAAAAPAAPVVVPQARSANPPADMGLGPNQVDLTTLPQVQSEWAAHIQRYHGSQTHAQNTAWHFASQRAMTRCFQAFYATYPWARNVQGLPRVIQTLMCVTKINPTDWDGCTLDLGGP